MNTIKKFQFLPFLICILIPIAIGAIGGFLTMESVKTWYMTLNKPSFNPPGSIFGPVWSFLYVTMGVSSYLIWQKRKTTNLYSWAVAAYLLQLLLNLTWSYLFFYQQEIGAALVEIVILLLTIGVTAFLFYRIDKLAGWLYLPYFLWVSFASYLTYSIYILN